ncbi:hypothetical protein H6F67_06780 [Microcoleus sp. FACHB-1515]|uniref:hypothetical protein n=1 Tax=Cyanophyceae TaxID=3028117 RepID=UPI0016858122|nr:hypothetical protein [Microcoleus sp. FACHB-1515]MBD2089555.1 hypothetical protein [Microcoleus sp. FACHB-1515]
MTFTLLRSSAELVDPSLLQASVKSVFSSFNWSDRPAALQFDRPNEPFNLTMSVQQFFSGFAWKAGAIAPLAEPELPPSDRNFTLDDFSALF